MSSNPGIAERHGGSEPLVLIAQSGSAAMPREARAWTLIGVLGVSLGGIVLLMLLSIAVIVLRRKRRLATMKADTERRRAVDPWVEAGKRAGTPDAEELEEE
ncbi:MAG: hypothetical protein IT435_09720 [Phycisphaerales bacterium]|nr:hypothetical protein [Phycisphaerales bacterium]